RDAASVPVIRGILNAALGVIGVDPEVRDDIQVMLAEACTNVVLHARAADEYAVTARVCEDLCVLKVTDEGERLIDEAVPEVAGLAESGRGLEVMDDLVGAVVRDDIQSMLAEACTNVVLHARAADEYAVTARVCEDLCVLKVTDEGGGLIDEAVPEVAGLAESGRGLKIMEDLADAMLVA